MTLAGIGHLL